MAMVIVVILIGRLYIKKINNFPYIRNLNNQLDIICGCGKVKYN